MRSTLVGRDRALDDAFAALQGTGRLVVEGPAGIGKSALLHVLAQRAADRGDVVLRCAPTETEAALPLAALADLIRPVADAVQELPVPLRQAARLALLLDGNEEPVDERSLAAATRTLLDAAASRSPTGALVVVDDVQWLDPPSERALRFALRRAPDGIRVLVTRRVGGDDPPVPLGLDDPAPAVRMGLPPLGVGPLHHLLAERFGVSLSRPVVVRLARESGGNPLLAIELTRAALRLPRLPGPADDLPVPTSMHDLVAASLATLAPDAVRAARVAALSSAPRLADLVAAGVAPDDLDAVEEIGLVTVDADDEVRFVHPVYASAVRAAIPTGVRRRLHAHLAETSTDQDERVRHLVRSAGEPDDAVAAEVAAAAERGRARGAPDLAAELYDRAAALAVDTERAATLRLRALQCLFDSGEYRLAAERADTMAQELTGDLLAEALLLRAAIAFGADDLPLAGSTAQRALAAATPSSRLAGRIHTHLAVFVDLAAPAREHAERALALLDSEDGTSAEPAGPGHARDAGLGGSDDELLASVLMLLFLNEVRAGLPPRVDVLDRALALEAGNPSRLAGTVPPLWWRAVDDCARARQRLQAMLDLAVAAGDEPLQHELMEHLADTEIHAGRYEQAASWVRGARDLAAQLGAGGAATRWLGGTLDALRGDLAAAAAAGAAGLAEAADSGDPWLRRISLQLTGFVALADGRGTDSAAAYAELAAAVDLDGLAEPIGTRFEPDWLEACVAVGDLVTAQVALDHLIRRHDGLPRPWTTLGLARSRVLLASAAGDDTTSLVEALLSALKAVPADVVPFDRARCLHVAGLAHRRARRKRAARDALLAAADAFDALGARSFAARARADADRTGVRVALPQELSSSELRVATLAAGGSTNREIADALFISAKTVEANLARVYRKLRIGRRVELTAALGERRAGQE